MAQSTWESDIESDIRIAYSRIEELEKQMEENMVTKKSKKNQTPSIAEGKRSRLKSVMCWFCKSKEKQIVVEILNTVNVKLIKREKEHYYERKNIHIKPGERFIVSIMKEDMQVHIDLPNTWFMILNKENYVICKTCT